MKNMPQELVHFLETAWIPLLEVAIGLLVGPWVKRIIVRMARKSSDKGLMTFLGSAANMMIIVISIIMAAEALGVKMNSVLALISALGLGVALALKGNMANVAGGIQILITKPFKVGDYIQVDSHKGLVTAIELMFTTIRTDNGKEAVVPNSEMVEDLIINYSKYPSIRIKAPFTFPVGCDYLKIRKEILEMMKVNPYFDKTQPVDVVFTGLTSSAISMEVVGYVKVEFMEECKHLIYQDLASGLNYYRHGSTSEQEIKIVKSFGTPAASAPENAKPQPDQQAVSDPSIPAGAAAAFVPLPKQNENQSESGLQKLKQFEQHLKQDFAQTFDPIFHISKNQPASSGTDAQAIEDESPALAVPQSSDDAPLSDIGAPAGLTPPSPVPAAPAGGFVPIKDLEASSQSSSLSPATPQTENPAQSEAQASPGLSASMASSSQEPEENAAQNKTSQAGTSPDQPKTSVAAD